MQVNEEVTRLFPGFLVVCLKRDPPEPILSHKFFKATNLNTASMLFKMAFFLVDEAEVSVEALRLPRCQLRVVNESRIAQNLREEVLLDLRSQQIDFMGRPGDVARSIGRHALRPRPLFVDEAEELGLVLRKRRRKHECLPEGLQILRLYVNFPITGSDHKLEQIQQLSKSGSVTHPASEDVVVNRLRGSSSLTNDLFEAFFDLLIVTSDILKNNLDYTYLIFQKFQSFQSSDA